MKKRECWNKCDVCGRFIPFKDFADGSAIHWMTYPDSEFTFETYETLCKIHNNKGNICQFLEDEKKEIEEMVELK